ncbi:hypothetical protein WR25_10271 isoform D [Diploscapter pachys]|uniref:Large ribosomal subunit protein eL33 n=1 Tax=Diploscapter pachys TaxID=2018661 RepID=A0A2A2LFR8_9BILA|nr:hypothetical protein WR25_10271 isoform B [Diploscapter pachys]PAV85009.1 hypothetical protein WR25_10271 isoform D [Diploscapter pachys]
MADAQRSAAKPGPRPAGRLYVKGVFTGYRRNHHQQQEHTALLKLEGVFDQKAANFYVGKRACYLYKAHKKVTVRICSLIEEKSKIDLSKHHHFQCSIK